MFLTMLSKEIFVSRTFLQIDVSKLNGTDAYFGTDDVKGSPENISMVFLKVVSETATLLVLGMMVRKFVCKMLMLWFGRTFVISRVLLLGWPKYSCCLLTIQ